MGLWQSTPHPPVESDPNLGQQEPPCQRAESMMSKRAGQTSWDWGLAGSGLSSQYYLHILLNEVFRDAASRIIFHSA